MGPLPTGPRNAHIKASYGPDTNLMKFYITQNSTTYGKYWDKFKPRQGKHTGTGYLANFRPGVYYSQRLDDLDNPVMSRICAKNYHTVTELSYQPYRENTGTEPLPNFAKQVKTGFVREKRITNPLDREVKGVFIDTRAASAPADILPLHQPRLSTLQGKNPIEEENQCYGPNYMSTETHHKFQKPIGRGMPSYKSVCSKEETGFTHAYNIEPVTYYPNKTFAGELPGNMTIRPTGVSMMKTQFLPSEDAHGEEPLPNVAPRSDHHSGYVREKARPMYLNRVMKDAYDHTDNMPNMRLEKTKKNNPADYFNMEHPDNYTSVYKNQFKGIQRPLLNEADRLSRTDTGFKEPTGYVENNDRFVQEDDDIRRFTTHYMTRFRNRTFCGLDREGHCRAGIQSLLPDGFTKSTAVHSNGPDINSTDTLRRLEPYVSRSIKARDVYYDDHMYDSKMHPVQLTPCVN